MEIKIDPELRDLLRALTDEEKNHLTADLIDNGCRDPLVVWGDILLDGHNRHDICTRNHIEFATVEAPDWIKGRADAIKWIIDNQRGKRNLTPQDIRYLVGKHYNAAKKEHGGDRKSDESESSRQSDDLKTADKVAADHGVSPRTVERAGDFAAKVDAVAAEEGEQAKREILEGKRKLPKEEKEKAKKDALEDETIIESLRCVAREIEDSLDILDAATKGKIKTICMRIMDKV